MTHWSPITVPFPIAPNELRGYRETENNLRQIRLNAVLKSFII